jgi:hypothetical protein
MVKRMMILNFTCCIRILMGSTDCQLIYRALQSYRVDLLITRCISSDLCLLQVLPTTEYSVEPATRLTSTRPVPKGWL